MTTSSAPERMIALVRGMNVGRGPRIPAAEFAEAVVDAGGLDVRTYLHTGNAVCDLHGVDLGSAEGRAEVSARLERALVARTGFEGRTVVFSAAALDRVVAANPFPDLAATPKQIHVLFCEEQPPPDPTGLGLRHGEDELVVGDRVVYVGYRSGMSSRSPLVTVLPKVAAVSTARNWSTVTALHGLARSV